MSASQLANISERANPFQIGGVQSGAPGIRVTQEGYNKYFGTLPYSPDVSANILSQSRVVDSGAELEYVKDGDYYMLKPKHSEQWYCFRRHENEYNGRVSGHYVWSEDDLLPESVLSIETIHDAKRRVSTRQWKQLKKVNEVQKRLGYPGSQALIDMIPTIDNIGITAADVRLRDAVVGRPIETFKGKSTRPPQLPSNPPLAPRITQKQQVLIIDIMYILGIPLRHCPGWIML